MTLSGCSPSLLNLGQMILGTIQFLEFLKRQNGKVVGKIITDAKLRTYRAEYTFVESQDSVQVSRADGTGDTVALPAALDLDEALIAFLGIYSGDGAKGSEDKKDRAIIRPTISFSQREPHLVKFAFDNFKKIFGDHIRFTFSLGEDSAYFLDGEGLQLLREYYGGTVPKTKPLSEVKEKLTEKDEQYLQEVRNVPESNEVYLAFYYQHKTAMEEILSKSKREEILASGLELGRDDKVVASLRRPFKKGARLPGGSSRSDELHAGGVNKIGELFIKIIHEAEDSILKDVQESETGLIVWNDKPSAVGQRVDIKQFFSHSPYGQINGRRPEVTREAHWLTGKWPGSRELKLRSQLTIDPLFCYVAGLYLAEGSTPKSSLFAMYTGRASGLNLGFTSSEDISLQLLIRCLQNLFDKDDCLSTWKIKVGSQYFPELVAIGLKEGVPMLRGGASGDGKLRTMEISFALKPWALSVAPTLLEYADRFSHVEPTGAGLARIDFSASSTVSRWYFPLLMFAVFANDYPNPVEAF